MKPAPPVTRHVAMRRSCYLRASLETRLANFQLGPRAALSLLHQGLPPHGASWLRRPGQHLSMSQVLPGFWLEPSVGSIAWLYRVMKYGSVASALKPSSEEALVLRLQLGWPEIAL
jgi:hypothetical protein